jgi:hypothetical protein
MGKAEAMMLFSLLYETYPDGAWRQLHCEVRGKTVEYSLQFTGTNVFDVPLATAFLQVKDHERLHRDSENSEEMASRRSSSSSMHQRPHPHPHLHQHLGSSIMERVAEYNSASFTSGGSFAVASLAAGGGKGGGGGGYNSSAGSIRSSGTAAKEGTEQWMIPGISMYSRSSAPRSKDCDNISAAGTGTGVDFNLTLTGSTESDSSKSSPRGIANPVRRNSEPMAVQLLTAKGQSAAAPSGDVINIPRSKRLDIQSMDHSKSTASGLSTRRIGLGVGGAPFSLAGSSTTKSIGSAAAPTFSMDLLQRSNSLPINYAKSSGPSTLTSNSSTLQKSSVTEKKKCEVVFNDYNLIVQIIISPILN